jgi:hypothetical protein
MTKKIIATHANLAYIPFGFHISELKQKKKGNIQKEISVFNSTWHNNPIFQINLGFKPVFPNIDSK